MNIIRLVNGSILKTEDKTVYYIPTFNKTSDNKRSIDLTILEIVDISESRDTGRKFYEGYKGHISDKLLTDWQKAFIKSGDDSRQYDIFDLLQNALKHCDNFGLTLGSSKDKPRTLDFWQENADGSVNSLGRVKLETIEIVPSTGRLLETIVLNLRETAEKNSELHKNAEGKEAKEDELKRGLDELTRLKYRMEDRLYRAFTKVLNEKKKKILELERRVRLLEEPNQTLTPNSSSKLQVPQRPKRKQGMADPISSEEEEMERSSSPEYEKETDVQDSDSGIILKQTTPKSSKRKTKQSPNSSNSSGERPTCSRKLFPLETDKVSNDSGSPTTKIKIENLSQKSTDETLSPSPVKGKVVADSETDFTDSSQELFVPNYCKRPTRQSNLRPTRNSSQECVNEPFPKKSRLVDMKKEPDDVEKMVDEPNHILNRIFGSA